MSKKDRLMVRILTATGLVLALYVALVAFRGPETARDCVQTLAPYCDTWECKGDVLHGCLKVWRWKDWPERSSR